MDSAGRKGTPHAPGIPLAMVRPGCRTKLVAVRGGRGMVQRLAAMGLVPGAEIEVVSTNGAGPMVIKVMESRVVLGRGMAQRIVVN